MYIGTYLYNSTSYQEDKTLFDKLFFLKVLILLSNIDKCECSVEFHVKHFMKIRIRLY